MSTKEQMIKLVQFAGFHVRDASSQRLVEETFVKLLCRVTGLSTVSCPR
jgi:hypothetical protein